MVAVIEAAGALVHCPAVVTVVEGADKHRQAVQPVVTRAEEEQQHLFKHRLLEQSKLEVQFSPGEETMQEPEAGEHALHPSLMALALQQ